MAVAFTSFLADVDSSKAGSVLNVTASHTAVLAAVENYLERLLSSSSAAPAPAHQIPTHTTYSCMQCSHLPHDVPFPPAMHFSGLVPLELSAPPDTQRACLLSNVCLNDDGQIEYYLHPYSRRLPQLYLVDSLKEGLVRMEGIEGDAWSPRIKRHALPSNYAFNDDADVHLYTTFHSNNNFGHNLIDNVFTHWFAMQHFNVGGYNSSRLISKKICMPVSYQLQFVIL
jgi:hypothetical protein